MSERQEQLKARMEATSVPQAELTDLAVGESIKPTLIADVGEYTHIPLSLGMSSVLRDHNWFALTEETYLDKLIEHLEVCPMHKLRAALERFRHVDMSIEDPIIPIRSFPMEQFDCVVVGLAQLVLHGNSFQKSKILDLEESLEARDSISTCMT